MSELLGTLMNMFSGNGLTQLSEKAGVDKKSTGKALTAILPSLIHALGRNSSSPEGAESLTNALKKDHDGSILDDVLGALQGSDGSSGLGILGHIFGKKQPAVETGLSKTTGIDTAAIGKIMSLVAPFLMGALGKTRQKNQLGANNINSLLLNENKNLSRRSKKKLSPILQFIDQDGDGEVTDDLLNIGIGFLSRLFKRRR